MFAVIYIPDFFLQAALRPDWSAGLRSRPDFSNRPVALIDESLPKPVIVQLTEAARRSGVCLGMTSTQAMARCREVVIKSRSAEQEAAAADVLLQCSYLFSPYVEATAPGICTLDLKGQSSAGNTQFGQSIIALLEQFHLRAQVGVAPTPAVALHAARCAAPFLRIDDPSSFLNALPIETLDPSPPLLSILQKWGISTVGQFLALGKDALAERLGIEALELFSRASTTDIRPLKLAQPPEVFEETFEFENEIESLEPLLFILRRFLDQLALRLFLSSFAAEEILLRLTLANNSHYERAFKIPAPTTDVNVLFRVLFTHLENVRTDHPVKALYLRAKPCRPTSEQFGLFDSVLRDPNHFYETVGRLTALLGPDCVGIPAPLNTHRPDAFELHPIDSVITPKTVVSSRSAKRSPSSLRGERAGVRGPSLPNHKFSIPNFQFPIFNSQSSLSSLPLRRFRPPIPAQVNLQQNHPITLHSSLFRGSIHHSLGPWRTSGHWWENQLWHRDEWDIQITTGRLYRLFHEHDGWFIEGVYD